MNYANLFYLCQGLSEYEAAQGIVKAAEENWRQYNKLAEQLQQDVADLDVAGYRSVSVSPEKEALLLHHVDMPVDVQAKWHNVLYKLAEDHGLTDVLTIHGDSSSLPQDSFQIHLRPAINIALSEKTAYSTFVNTLGQLTNHLPGRIADFVPGDPSPLTAMLTSGLLGAGLGYGGGYLMGSVLPGWNKKRLAATGAVLGGLTGAAPGAVWGWVNSKHNKPLTSGWPIVPDKPARIDPTWEFEEDLPDTKAAAWDNDDTGAGGMFPPPIPVPALRDTLYYDPNVAFAVNPATRNAAMSLVDTAAFLAESREQDPQRSSMVTMGDLGRLTAGMGTGYVAGALFGKALGSIFGLPQKAQDILKTTGVVAGVINALTPMAFTR